MKPITRLLLAAGLLFTVLLQPHRMDVQARGGNTRQSLLAFGAPVLLWSRGGCTTWCQTGWYSSPAVANLDGDPQAEVVGAAYSIFILDGLTGATQTRASSGHSASEGAVSDVGRTWPDIVLANIDTVPGLEIVTAHSGGWLSAYSTGLAFKPGWPKQITPGSELRSLASADLDGNGNIEILAAATRSENQWYAFEHTGILRASNWPQHYPDSTTNGYTAGCYNQNIAAGDLDGDHLAEILGPNDTHYIAAFQDTGVQIPANPIYGENRVWSRVGVHVSHEVDLRGYAYCGSEHRPNFAHSAPIIVDLDGNGTLEAVVIGNVYNCATSPYTDLYEIPFIFNADRTRWKAGSYDWTVLPTPEPGSAPLSENYNVIENTHPNPTAADLDGDGILEILYPSYDGRMHAYWLDKTEHDSWPYSVKKSNENFIRFASEALVADLDADGKAEVIFTSWTQKGSNQTGKLHILASTGAPIYEIDLPPADGANWNGGLAAPTLANLDGEPGLELIVNTAHSGLVAYDLPDTSAARVLWGTGRGSYLRSGSLIHGYLEKPVLTVNDTAPQAGDNIYFTTTLSSFDYPVRAVQYQNTLPTGLTPSGSPSASSGEIELVGSTLTWSGDILPTQAVTITFQAVVDSEISGPTLIYNTGVIDAPFFPQLQLDSLVIVNGKKIFLPSIQRN